MITNDALAIAQRAAVDLAYRTRLVDAIGMLNNADVWRSQRAEAAHNFAAVLAEPVSVAGEG